MLQAGKSLVRLPMRSLNFFNLLEPSSLSMALVLTDPLTEISTKNFPWVGGGEVKRGRLVKLTTSPRSVCDPIV
jgi:hypothetical protein